MADKPILFSAPMVQALLAGRKTQTRRILKDQPGDLDKPFMMDDGSWHVTDSQGAHMSPLPIRIKVGDRLYVREAWTAQSGFDRTKPSEIDDDESNILYLADQSWMLPPDDMTKAGKGRPGIFMPRWASRLTLTVTGVKVARLQAISEEDAIAEGAMRIGDEYIKRGSADFDKGPNFWKFEIDDFILTAPTAQQAYASLWDWINGEDAWSANPWVVAYSFTVTKQNIDRIAA